MTEYNLVYHNRKLVQSAALRLSNTFFFMQTHFLKRILPAAQLKKTF